MAHLAQKSEERSAVPCHVRSKVRYCFMFTNILKPLKHDQNVFIEKYVPNVVVFITGFQTCLCNGTHLNTHLKLNNELT